MGRHGIRLTLNTNICRVRGFFSLELPSKGLLRILSIFICSLKMKEVGQLTCGAPSCSGKLYVCGSISTARRRDASEHLTKPKRTPGRQRKGERGTLWLFVTPGGLKQHGVWEGRSPTHIHTRKQVQHTPETCCLRPRITH